MNYTIPKSRQQVIEIYNDLMSRPIIYYTKYDMFIGALCECSDKEFKEYNANDKDDRNNCNICDSFYFDCDNFADCKDVYYEIFSKRWNE